jgi:hypothetical protein
MGAFGKCLGSFGLTLSHMKKSGGGANQTAATEVDQTYIDEGFLCHREHNLSWNPQGQHTRRRARSWMGTVEEDAEIMGKTWREVKAIAGNSVLALLCEGPVL